MITTAHITTLWLELIYQANSKHHYQLLDHQPPISLNLIMTTQHHYHKLQHQDQHHLILNKIQILSLDHLLLLQLEPKMDHKEDHTNGHLIPQDQMKAAQLQFKLHVHQLLNHNNNVVVLNKRKININKTLK